MLLGGILLNEYPHSLPESILMRRRLQPEHGEVEYRTDAD